jgi:hypothetical protein
MDNWSGSAKREERAPASPAAASWSDTVYGPTTPRPRKRAAPGAPVAASSTKRAGTATTPSKTAGTPAKRAPRKTTAAAKPRTDVLAELDVVLADASAPASGPDTAGSASQPAPLWTLLVADPALAPEHLAREAVRRLGPVAREWVDRTRERYPQARPDALARLAIEEHIRVARREAMANATALGAWAEVGLLGRTQARLALTIAAVYGADPTAEDRVRDLLALLPIPRLQPSLATAGKVGRLLGAVVVRRMGARMIPFGAAVAGVIHSGRTTEDVGLRAIAHFRPDVRRGTRYNAGR